MLFKPIENGGEKEESCEPLSVAGKSSSAESVQLQGGSSSKLMAYLRYGYRNKRYLFKIFVSNESPNSELNS